MSFGHLPEMCYDAGIEDKRGATMNQPTINKPTDILLAELRDLQAQVLNHQQSGGAFVAAVNAVEWSNQPAEAIRAVIELALNIEAVRIARQLAEVGHRAYPEDAWLKRATVVLAPPKIIGTSPARPGQKATMLWLQDHAHEYYQQWVAVRDGVFLGAGETRQGLVEKLGSIAHERGTVITRIV